MSLPIDRLLTSLLRQYQSVHDEQQIDRIFATTTSLLTTLQNPLNVTLLTSHFLAAPAIWSRPNSLRTCQRIMAVYHTAAINISSHDQESNTARNRERTLTCADWTRAVLKGADERSPRWRHVLVIGGVLLGLARREDRVLPSDLRFTLESAVLTASNLALKELRRSDEFGGVAVVLALNYVFQDLRDSLKASLDYDSLASPIIAAILGSEGYDGGSVVRIIDSDVRYASGNTFGWPKQSSSFLQLQALASKPLVASMGPLSRLAGHTIGSLTASGRILGVLDDLLLFSGSICKQWRLNKLSEVVHSEESLFFTTDTLNDTLPVLWQVFKGLMFAVVNILRAAIGRALIDPALTHPSIVISVATKALHILRNIYFITARFGTNTFSAHVFVHMTSIDILTHFPGPATDFLKTIAPPYLGTIPSHPLDRNLDLFFLNTSEHFTLALSPDDNESLIFAAASPYINTEAHSSLLEIFEAAHSAVLALLSAPRNGNISMRIIPFYIQALFNLFPRSLSARQFRFALKTLVQITTPPSPLANTEPLMAETILELLRHRALNASTSLISHPATGNSDGQQILSEQAVLVLSLIDALPQLRPTALEEWLPLTADILNSIKDLPMREACKARFWEALESGEMDVERAVVCVAWWTTRGGREIVMSHNHNSGGAFMSGALAARDGSRL